ncbi:hypothetical protein GIB67_031122 [Kingdonia uniflora]|uniref:Pentatricopeptide repeat-containing protein n=1 Tax=Kingdonia uniflora TaxID=39325 RepID=A0A7J7MEK0_9MAGN|nr:hypothetical protein GIB67_031122 [Kingdonia uniflora]
MRCCRQELRLTLLPTRLCDQGKLEEAKVVISEMLERGVKANHIIFITLVDAYFKVGKKPEALKMIEEMQNLDIVPTVVTFCIIIDGLCKAGLVQKAMDHFRSMANMSLHSNVLAYTTLVDGLCKNYFLEEAEKLFVEMLEKGIVPDKVAYTALVDGPCKNNFLEEADKPFDKMLEKGIVPDKVAYTSLMDGYLKHGSLEEAFILRSIMVENGIDIDLHAYTTLIWGLCQCKQMQCMAHYNPFDNLQSLGDDSNAVDTGNNSSSNTSSKKKRRLTRDIGFQVRIYLPIIYESFKDVPNDRIPLVVKGLKECYDISHVVWFDLKEKIRDAWKWYKYHLNTTLIVGNNPGDVKASPAPEFVPMEDWVKFVDYYNSEKFLANSKRNKENREKLIAPYTLGKTSMPITRHKLAEKRGVTDEEIGRVEVYIPAHTKKDKTIQCSDVIAELQNTMRKDPKSIRMGPNDAIAQKFGTKGKGRTRGMGAGMSISLVEKVVHIVNKIEELRSTNNELKFATEKLRKDLDALAKYVGNIPVSSVLF